jgi:feruloyl esterase
LSALDAWVEHGVAPEQLIASRSVNGVVDRTRPLCLYPAVAGYKGSGSIDKAESFACSVSAPGVRPSSAAAR